MNPTLSIIIPCFNVENFLPICLKHILQLPLKSEEYEIICYDDCSSDKTLSILKEMSNSHLNIKFIQALSNTGPGGGRNNALREANGDYIWFVDADDVVLLELIPSISSYLISKEVDVIAFNYKIIDIHDNIIAEPIVFHNSTIMRGLDFVESVFQTGIIFHMGYPWRFIVKRTYLIQNNILFPENIRYGEDTVWMPQILLEAQKVVSVSAFGYMYRQHNQSTCGLLNSIYPGQIIYERCIITSALLLEFSNKLSSLNDERIYKYVQAFCKAVKQNYIGQLPICLCRSSLKERKVFYSYLNQKGFDRIILSYTPFLSHLILMPFAGRIIAEVLAIVYKLNHR